MRAIIYGLRKSSEMELSMYRARIGVQEKAETCPYHIQVPKTMSLSYHQDTIVNERSGAGCLVVVSPRTSGRTGEIYSVGIGRDRGLLYLAEIGGSKKRRETFRSFPLLCYDGFVFLCTLLAFFCVFSWLYAEISVLLHKNSIFIQNHYERR